MQTNKGFFLNVPISNRTLTLKPEKYFSGNHSKKQVTLTVHSNMSGIKKQKLLIIRKNENSRCFERIESLETNCDFNKKT